jgi:hypothetical protein
MPYGIDPAIHRVEAVRFQWAFDLPSCDPGGQELGAGNDSVLLRRERRDHRVGPMVVLLTTYLVFNCTGVLHVAQIDRAAATRVLRG